MFDLKPSIEHYTCEADLPWEYRKQLEVFLDKNAISWVLVNEVSDTGKEHFHFWITGFVKNNKRSTFIKNLGSEFPQLKKEGKGGYHKYTCAHPGDPMYQYAYIFKYVDNVNSNITYKNLTPGDKNELREYYWKHKAARKLGEGDKFYQFCCQESSDLTQLTVPEFLVQSYVKFCVKSLKKRVNYPDLINHVNFVLARSAPQTLEKMFRHKFDRDYPDINYYGI